ncbi:MAG: VOC family protein [Dehalococcoidia bacterium]
MSATITRLNHAVLYVRDLDRAVEFYQEAFGFEEIGREGGRMAFLRAQGGTNHHDLGLMEVGENAPSPPPGATGLYHLAWQVGRIEDLAEMEVRLANMGALGGRSDHGATKSLYAHDPDGNEFEVMWMVPREEWGEYENRGVVMPLNMEQEVARFGGR